MTDTEKTMSMQERVIVITGATGGLGRVAALKFAQQGGRLVLVGTNTDKLQRLSEELKYPGDRILLHTADVSQPPAASTLVGQVLEKFGRIDILLLLIGGWSGGKPVIETDRHQVETMLQQHLWTTYHLAQAIIPAMTANRWGRIIAISSPFASHPQAGLSPYAIGKAAQESLMLTVAQEVKESGITANLLLVKTIDTEHVRDLQPSSKNASWTTPEEITATLLHLCSDEARMINGARIPLVGN
jgi:NAD(P)-dependent dehydrogenase (short-subunit alcohol dehydrogenase family)